jgi:hypothetical protein
VVLSRRRCPYTGVVNFFAETDPFLAVGSVTKPGAPEVYYWRCYTDDRRASGVAHDLKTAERHLSRHYSQTESARHDEAYAA